MSTLKHRRSIRPDYRALDDAMRRARRAVRLGRVADTFEVVVALRRDLLALVKEQRGAATPRRYERAERYRDEVLSADQVYSLPIDQRVRQGDDDFTFLVEIFERRLYDGVFDSFVPYSDACRITRWVVGQLYDGNTEPWPMPELARPPKSLTDAFRQIQKNAQACEPEGAQPVALSWPLLAAVIDLNPNGLRKQVDALAVAIREAAPGLFQRNGELAELTWQDDTRPGGEPRERPVLHPVSEMRLLELAGRAARFERFDARKKEMVAARCPADLVRMLMARPSGEMPFPVLRGIINRPTLRPDGSLIEDEGYDEQTGLLLLAAERLEYQWGLGHVSRMDAYEATDTLNELLDEFPFVGDADWSAAFAAILTAVAREALPNAPMFAFTAPAPGTGKSYLVDLINAVATGHPAAGSPGRRIRRRTESGSTPRCWPARPLSCSTTCLRRSAAIDSTSL